MPEGQQAPSGAIDRVLRQIAAKRLSGKVRFTRPGQEAAVLFENGRVVETWSDLHHGLLGQVLLERRNIAEPQLVRALETQRNQPGRRVGEILLEMGAIRRSHLRGALVHQCASLVSQLRAWDDATYTFSPTDPGQQNDFSLSMSEVLLDRTIESPRVPKAGANDEQATARFSVLGARRARLTREPVVAQPRLGSPASAPETLERVEGLERHTATLRTAKEAEALDSLLDHALLYCDRVALFHPDNGDMTPVAYRVRSHGRVVPLPVRVARLPTRRGALLGNLLDRGTTTQAHAAIELEVVEQLGGEPPTFAVAIPMYVGEHLHLVLYGDVLPPSGKPNYGLLEAAVAHTGLALERRWMRQCVKELQNDNVVLAREVQRLSGSSARVAHPGTETSALLRPCETDDNGVARPPAPFPLDATLDSSSAASTQHETAAELERRLHERGPDKPRSAFTHMP